MSTSTENVNGEKFRVVVLTHGGADEVLQRLAESEVEVVGVIVETETIRQYNFQDKLRRSIRYDGYLATLSKVLKKLLRHAENTETVMAEESRNQLEKIAQRLNVPFYTVENYHSQEAIELLRSTEPDLGVIYGTNIIKESVFSVPKLGSINLHQGLAPYYRGGPPIFWELFNGEAELGLTVHYVAAKVDSGDIILQETIPLEYSYEYDLDYERFIDDLSPKLKTPCARLVAEAVHLIAAGSATPKKQDSTLGKRYRLPVKAEKNELRRRLRARRQKQQKAWKGSHAELG